MSGVEPNPDEVFDVERIRQLVELMEEHGLTEIDLRREDQRIRLRRGGEVAEELRLGPSSTSPPLPTPPVPVVAPGQRADDDKSIVIIRSPMVGTFYGRPNPEAEAFVKVGSHIAPDTTVCIIEAMKVFNEIPAEVSGTVVAVLADDEEPVDFGKPLFKIDTSR